MDASPLARLPPELRNMIYRMALCKDWDRDLVLDDQKSITFVLDSDARHKRGECRFKLSPGTRISLALTETCRDIRHESLGIVYSGNTFTLDSDCDWDFEEDGARRDKAMRMWCNDMGMALQFISHVHIRPPTIFLEDFLLGPTGAATRLAKENMSEIAANLATYRLLFDAKKVKVRIDWAFYCCYGEENDIYPALGLVDLNDALYDGLLALADRTTGQCTWPTDRAPEELPEDPNEHPPTFEVFINLLREEEKRQTKILLEADNLAPH